MIEPKPIKIVSVLGGPGSGKGTQCSILQRAFQYAHFSVGDLLRAEAAKDDSPYRKTITENMRMGHVGPKEITVGILQQNIQQVCQRGVRTFFLDGFPRKMDQKQYFEDTVGPICVVLLFECPTAVLLERLRERGCSDDDADTIERRVATLDMMTKEVLGEFERQEKVVRIRANESREVVFESVVAALEERDVHLHVLQKDIGGNDTDT